MRNVDLVDPQVPTFIAYGRGHKTEKTFHYTRSYVRTVQQDVQEGPSRTDFEDGDGTVSVRSAMAPLGARWGNVTAKAFNHEHTAIAKASDVFDWVMNIVLSV